MEGKIASRYPDPAGHYSELKVMLSGAGYYLGTEFVHTSGDFEGLVEPGSRESGYFKTYEAAEAALKAENWVQREHP